MAARQGGAALITGANAGIGKEVARQLAERDEFDTIYLACRNDAKAQAARADLERVTARSVFTTVRMDVSDPDSVRTAIDLIDTPLRAVVLNAGGSGGPTPLAKTKDGVTEIFASNVLGHVVLLEKLIATGALTTGGAGRQRVRPWHTEVGRQAARLHRSLSGRIRQRHRRIVR